MSSIINHNGYKEETWGKKVDGEDIIDGYKFRGRQPFLKARENIEKMMVRDAKFDVGNTKCKVLDVREKGIELEMDVEMIGKEKGNRGVAVIKLYGPNKKKENVVLVTKYKQSDIKFVTLMAENVIKPLIKKFLDVEKEETADTSGNANKCEYCENTFNTIRGLKGHMTKKHREVKETTNQTIKSTKETSIEEDIEKASDVETDSEETLDIEEEKKYSSKCKSCNDSFQTSRKYELIQQVKKHKKTCIKCPRKNNQKYCTTCDFTTSDEQCLKRQKRDKHDENSASTSPPPKKSKIDTKQSQEEMEIDEEDILDMEIDEVIIRSKIMDEKVENKARKIEEEEKRYQEKKIREQEKEKEKRKLENETRKLSTKQKKQKIKDEKKKARKKKEVKTDEFQSLPNIKPVPKNIAHLCNTGDLVYRVPGNGACGPNSIAAHLFKDEVFGPKLKRMINEFKVKHWDQKYKFKTQCTVDSPFVRRVGNRGTVTFTDPKELFEYLQKADEADYMWTDCEDLIVVADMFQVKIKIITTKGENDKHPSENWIYPDEEMREFAELKDVEIDDIVLLHENDMHYNLIIAEDNELATVGSLSYMTNIVPLMKTNESDHNIVKEKTYVDVLVNGSKVLDDPKAEIERLRKALQKSSDGYKALQKQYDECEAALRKSTEESEKLKSELKDFKIIMKIENELEKTQSRAPRNNKNSLKTGSESFLEKSSQVFVTEEEFNCEECPYQGTELNQLNKHIQLKHRIQCRNCENNFKTKPELMVHRKSEHYNTVAYCRKGSSCEFSERCWWKHKKEDNDMIECYYCETSFVTKSEVMIHRKRNHPKTVKNCTKFENKNCIYNEDTCWFKHETEEAEKEEPNKANGDNAVFWKRQNNLKNP